jgi:hypothetical protein
MGLHEFEKEPGQPMEKRMKRLAAMCSILALVAGCASHSPQPDWTRTGRSSEFPPARYLTGTGVANNVSAASQRAQANLTKVFEVEIDSGTGNGGKYANAAMAKGIIKGHDTKVNHGIRIAETWVNPDTHVAHALAVLSRKQAADNLRAEITDLDDNTDIWLQRSHADADVLHKIRYAQLALNSQVARSAYDRSLRAVAVNGQGMKPRFELSLLNDNLDSLLKLVRVQPQVPADADPRLIEAAEQALAHAGFLVGAGKEADFILDTRLNMENLGFRDNWQWQRGVLSVVLKERQGNKVRGSYQWAIKAAGSSADDARERIVKQVGILLKKELRDVIVRIATH